ncbi:MAG: DUF305 domain-containing protein [Acaryochloridaceae cyanobacterium RU_4_10]|nr:DUF305 domain-containing protein [Acaryochloridaceae cyanobacterium RU_4_10]
MSIKTMRNNFVTVRGLILWVAIASLGGFFTSCNTDSKASSGPTMKGSGTMQGMGHGMSMDLGPADTNLDLRFIDAMIPHHQGAVVMAKEALQKSKRPEIKKLAKNILGAQNQEISQMKQWRSQWYPKASPTPMAWHADMGHEMPMSDAQKEGMMMRQNLGAADAKFDLRFIAAMIPHHQGAVDMAQDVLKKSKRPEIKKLAKDIIASQQVEIKQMQTWQKSWSSK